MALLAMDQLAWAVAGLRSGFEVGDTEEALRAHPSQGRVAVWAPYSLVAGRSDIPQSWTVTSDSLALWLGRRLGRRTLLCRSNPSSGKRADFSAEQLARDGVVDEAFPSMFRDAGFPAFLLGRGDQAALAASLSAPATPLAAQPSTNANALRTSPSPRSSKQGGVEVASRWLKASSSSPDISRGRG